MVGLNPTIGDRKGSDLIHNWIFLTNERMRKYTFTQGENSYTLQTQKMEVISIAFDTLKVISYLCNVAFNLNAREN